MVFNLKYIFISMVIVKVIPISTEYPKITNKDYRLSTNISPTLYSLSLTFTRDVFTGSNITFTGHVRIQFTVKNESQTIYLHAQHDYIKINKVVFANEIVPARRFYLNSKTDLLMINTLDEMRPYEKHGLEIEYTGKISTSDMYGVYKSEYRTERGDTKVFIGTMFAPTYARRAFPCFDEPALKAKFEVQITIPLGLEILFNTPSSKGVENVSTRLVTYMFNTTPQMSTYLISFVISEFTCTSGVPVGTAPFQICSRDPTSFERLHAIEFGPPLLEIMNRYTGYDYDKIVEKMDLVAIPYFKHKAMESLGLMTFSEVYLLFDEAECPNRNLQVSLLFIAHEIAHQWFGNLVTLKWWSELFMNEGFATYLGYYAAHKLLPEWEMNKQFVIEEMHTALLVDSYDASQALQTDCFTPSQIQAKFNLLSYSKGSSILKMVENCIGSKLFRAGLKDFLTRYQFRGVVPEKLWTILNFRVADLPYDLMTIMESWVKKPGYPLVTVSYWSENEVVITQERFTISGEEDDTQWYIPISYTLSQDFNKFKNTSPIMWLIPDRDEIFAIPDDADWIILNNQQADFYRVNYDEKLWNGIVRGLSKPDFDGIGDINRAQIVDDIFNLARANKLKHSEVLRMIGFLANDTSYYPWYAAFNGFDYVLKRVGRDSFLGRKVASTVLDLMSKLYNSVPLSLMNDYEQVHSLKLEMAHIWACKLGNEKCIQNARELFKKFKATRISPGKNLRDMVYCTALAHSTDGTDWEFLWERYQIMAAYPIEQKSAQAALGCSRDEAILKRYLNLSITAKSGIRPEDTFEVFDAVITGSAKGMDVAFEFITENHKIIASRYARRIDEVEAMMKTLVGMFTRQDQINKLKSFIENQETSEEFQIIAHEALHIAESNFKWLGNLEENLLHYYGNSQNRVLGTCFCIIIAAICYYTYSRY